MIWTPWRIWAMWRVRRGYKVIERWQRSPSYPGSQPRQTDLPLAPGLSHVHAHTGAHHTQALAVPEGALATAVPRRGRP